MLYRGFIFCALLLPSLLWARPAANGSLDHTGGPDGGGYTFVDNVGPDTATFAWVELRGDPGATWIAAWTNYDDGESPRLPIGFPFPYYGAARDSLRLSTNGWARLFPENANPAALYIFWDDLTLLAYGSDGHDRVAYKCCGDHTVIEYDSVLKHTEPAGPPLKFEAILYRNGSIKFQYQAVSANLTTVSIGIANPLSGTEFLYYDGTDEDRRPAAGRAVWFVSPPLPGDRCASAISLPLPHPGSPTVATRALAELFADGAAICGRDTARGVDLFYRLNLPDFGEPRRLALALTGRGDAHLSIYFGAAACGALPLLCNDDDAGFSPLPAWDSTAQHPRGTNAYIAAYFEPGEYRLRVSSSLPTDTLTLTIYDNTLCDLPCLDPPPLNVTCYPAANDNGQVELRFTPAWPGTVSIFSTLVRNNDGDPNFGIDPQWTLDTTLTVKAVAPMTWTDPIAGGSVCRHYVIYNRDDVVARCCYTQAGVARCANSTAAECRALGGLWTWMAHCGADPCPRAPAQP